MEKEKNGDCKTNGRRDKETEWTRTKERRVKETGGQLGSGSQGRRDKITKGHRAEVQRDGVTKR